MTEFERARAELRALLLVEARRHLRWAPWVFGPALIVVMVVCFFTLPQTFDRVWAEFMCIVLALGTMRLAREFR